MSQLPTPPHPVPFSGQQPFRAQSVASDQCSYCGMSGHWRRNCIRYANDLRGKSQKSVSLHKAAEPAKPVGIGQLATNYAGN